MNRTDIIQTIIDKKKAHRYLEIGVFDGSNFFPIKVRHKTAVDPNFAFSGTRKREWIFKNLYNVFASYYETTSDGYFADIKRNNRFDVIFIDGLHTYEQSLRDVLNSLGHLSEGGVIVMHDCGPPDQPAAEPAQSIKHAAELGSTRVWCGDVWKTVCYLRSFRKDLNVFVLDCDYGLGIVTKGEADSCLGLSEDELNGMTYKDFNNDRINLLNLKNENYLFEIFGSASI